jgi:microcystin-dependent protein
MPNSFTTNLNMTKPEVGADSNAWGGHLNEDLDILDRIFTSATTTPMSTRIKSDTRFVDATTTSKSIMLSLAAINTTTTRTLTIQDASGTVALSADITSAVSAAVPAGVIFPWAGIATTAPSGFLLCDGSAVNRTTYSALFAAVNTTYGAGNGTTTFNVPDLRGRSIAGRDNMGGTTAGRITNAGSGIVGTTMGASGGAQSVTPSLAGVTVSGTASGTVTGDIGENNAASLTQAGGPFLVASNTHIHAFTANPSTFVLSASIGGSIPALVNVQPTLIVNYIIKT